MSSIKKCTGGAQEAVLLVNTPTWRSSFWSDSPPLEIIAGETTPEAQVRISIQAHSTYKPYGEGGVNFVSGWIHLPVQRIFFENFTYFNSSVPSCKWFVTDNRGITSRFTSRQSVAHWMWGAGRRYSHMRVIAGEEPVRRWELHVKDAKERSKFWRSFDGPIPYEVVCGCKRGELTCGSFPSSFCCINCRSLTAKLSAIERQADGLARIIEQKSPPTP